MAGSFTRSVFYKSPGSTTAVEIQHTGVLVGGPTYYQYRITNNNPVATSQMYLGALNYTAASPIRTTTAAGSPALPTTAGASITIYLQELSPGAASFVVQGSTATVTAITVPVVNAQQTYSTQQAGTITHSPSLSTVGVGGVLELNKTSPDNTTYPTTGWVSSSAFTVDRGTQYNIWARRGEGISNPGNFASSTLVSPAPYLGLTSTVGSLTVGGVTNASPGNPLLVPEGGSATITWNNTISPGFYRIVRTTGTTVLVVSGVEGRTTGLISPSVLPPVGTTWAYQVEVKRDITDGGNNAYIAVTPTSPHPNPFYITTIVPAPTGISGATGAELSPTATVTITATGGSGTYDYSLDGVNYQASASFASQNRGATINLYARSTSGANRSSPITSPYNVLYNLPDLALSPKSIPTSILYNDTANLTYTYGDQTSPSRYRIERLDAAWSPVTLAAINVAQRVLDYSNFPSPGNSASYRIAANILVDRGGDGNFSATNISWTLSRTAVPVPNAPTAVAGGGVAPTVTISTTGGTGTYQYSLNGTTWQSSGDFVSQTRGATLTIYARSTYTDPLAVTYVSNPASSSFVVPSAPVVNPTQTPWSTSPDIGINHTMLLSSTGVGGTLEYATASSTTYNTGLITTWQSSASVPVNRGSGYYFWARRDAYAEAAAFAGPFSPPYLLPDTTATSLTVDGSSVATLISPAIISSLTSPVNVSWTGTAATVDYYRIVLSNPSPDTVAVPFSIGRNSGVISPAFLPNAQNDRWEYKIIARRTAAGGGNDQDYLVTGITNPFYIKQTAVGIIPTQRNIVAATRTPSGDLKTSEFNSDVTVNFTGTQNQRYKIVRTSGTVADVKVGSVLGSTGATSLNISPSFFPAEGSTSSYQIQTIRETAQNGDNVWYSASPASASFTVTKIQQPTVSDSQSFDSTTNSSTISHNIQLKANGAGGTLQYAISTSATYNTSLIGTWQSSPGVTLTRGNTYYMWARRSTEAGDADGSTAQFVSPYQAPPLYGLRVYNSSGTILLDITSRISRQLTRGGPTTITNGSTTTISVPSLGTADDSAVAVLYSPTSATNPFYVSPNYTAKTFTVTNNSGGTRSIYYYVINTGEAV